MSASRWVSYQDVVESVPISLVLGKYISLPKLTKHYRIPCPLHGSQNPTTMVITDDRVWYCHGCHAGGTVVDLYGKLERLSRSDAQNELVSEFCIRPLGGLRRGAEKAQWEMARFRPSPLHEIVRPSDVRPLLAPVRSLGMATVLHWGLAESDGGIYLPLRDSLGREVGYTIRRDGTPKYLNSKGLKKSQILYGLYENERYIRDAGVAVLVEGPFDALAVWDVGVRNVVAVLGSDLSQAQARLLLPLVDRLILCFDGDDAGLSGAEKIQEKWCRSFQISILDLPEGEDPGSLGKEELWKCLIRSL